MSKLLRTVAYPLLWLIAVPAMLLVMPLMFGLLAVDAYRCRKAVRGQVCPGCGAVLGIQSLGRAARERRGAGSGSVDESPGTDRAPSVDAVCRTCSARYSIDRDTLAVTADRSGGATVDG